MGLPARWPTQGKGQVHLVSRTLGHHLLGMSSGDVRHRLQQMSWGEWSQRSLLCWSLRRVLLNWGQQLGQARQRLPWLIRMMRPQRFRHQAWHLWRLMPEPSLPVQAQGPAQAGLPGVSWLPWLRK